MANAFSKEEVVAFEQLLEGFQDALVLSRNVNVYNTDAATMERARDTIWRPMPYIAQSFDSTVGSSISSNYDDMTQLSVPSTLGFSKTSAWKMTTKELRDALQEGRLGDAAKQKLASDINRSVMNVAANQGTLVVAVAGAAGDYDDVALCDAIMNETGVPQYDRYLALSTRDYNGLAGYIATGASGTDAVVIVVASGTSSNQPPVAHAGSDQTVTDSDNNGLETVVLDGSGSTDSDGSI